MNKFALSLIALAALSTASLAAGNRSWDLQDREYYTTNSYTDTSSSAVIVDESPLAAVNDTGTNFEAVTKRMMERDQGNR
jgi:hypothetical protein